MALPVVIAKNQTGSPISLTRLGLVAPASPSTFTLTDFASFFEIAADSTLNTNVNSGDIVINDGTTDLSATLGDAYLAATGNFNGPVTGLVDGALIKLDGTSGRYSKATGIIVDNSDNVDLGAGDLTTTGAVDLSGGTLTLPQGANPTPTAEGEIYWDTDDHVLRIGNGGGTTTIPTGASSFTTGTATLTFGAVPGTNIVETVVTGQATITVNSHIQIWMAADATATHNAYEHSIVPIKLSAADIVASTGFTIRAVTDWRLTGTFTVHWMWS